MDLPSDCASLGRCNATPPKYQSLQHNRRKFYANKVPVQREGMICPRLDGQFWSIPLRVEKFVSEKGEIISQPRNQAWPELKRGLNLAGSKNKCKQALAALANLITIDDVG